MSLNSPPFIPSCFRITPVALLPWFCSIFICTPTPLQNEMVPKWCKVMLKSRLYSSVWFGWVSCGDVDDDDDGPKRIWKEKAIFHLLLCCWFKILSLCTILDLIWRSRVKSNISNQHVKCWGFAMYLFAHYIFEFWVWRPASLASTE